MARAADAEDNDQRAECQADRGCNGCYKKGPAFGEARKFLNEFSGVRRKTYEQTKKYLNKP